jgi:hypothetical protein
MLNLITKWTTKWTKLNRKNALSTEWVEFIRNAEYPEE